jgi:hypothetical protein
MVSGHLFSGRYKSLLVGGEGGYGPEVQEALEARAERIIAEELQGRKWTDVHLAEKRKGDPGKVAIAWRLRSETTLTLEEIAKRLGMGTKTHLAHLLYWQRRGRGVRQET